MSLNFSGRHSSNIDNHNHLEMNKPPPSPSSAALVAVWSKGREQSVTTKSGQKNEAQVLRDSVQISPDWKASFLVLGSYCSEGAGTGGGINDTLLVNIAGIISRRLCIILWPPDAKNWLIGKDPDAGKDWRQEEKGMTEDEVVGWHHQLNGHEFEQAPGVDDGQGSLACCSPWGRKESDMQASAVAAHGLRSWGPRA